MSGRRLSTVTRRRLGPSLRALLWRAVWAIGGGLRVTGPRPSGPAVVVANHASDSFGRDTNRATLVSPNSADALGELPKPELADRIVDWISARLRGNG